MTGGTISLSHHNPISVASYNHTFCQIVTGDDKGIVKVWDLESNRKTFEFAIKIPISALAFDSSHRRLIIGCRDGTTRIYNHTFCQIVTGDDKGIVKVWDLESNRKTFEFDTKIHYLI